MDSKLENAWYIGITEKHFEIVIQKAILQEREACARVCDEYDDTFDNPSDCANAIRARSNSKGEPLS